MTLVSVALPGTEITYTEGTQRLFMQLVRIGGEIELQLVKADNEQIARALGALDGKVEYCISMVDLLKKILNGEEVDMLPS